MKITLYIFGGVVLFGSMVSWAVEERIGGAGFIVAAICIGAAAIIGAIENLGNKKGT